jgi:hypothetical protein
MGRARSVIVVMAGGPGRRRPEFPLDGALLPSDNNELDLDDHAHHYPRQEPLML